MGRPVLRKLFGKVSRSHPKYPFLGVHGNQTPHFRGRLGWRIAGEFEIFSLTDIRQQYLYVTRAARAMGCGSARSVQWGQVGLSSRHAAGCKARLLHRPCISPALLGATSRRRPSRFIDQKAQLLGVVEQVYEAGANNAIQHLRGSDNGQARRFMVSLYSLSPKFPSVGASKSSSQSPN